jgi:hypothetical protein
MGKLAIWAQLEAKPGKEKEVEEFLKSAEVLAEREAGTLAEQWRVVGGEWREKTGETRQAAARG